MATQKARDSFAKGEMSIPGTKGRERGDGPAQVDSQDLRRVREGRAAERCGRRQSGERRVGHDQVDPVCLPIEGAQALKGSLEG